MIGDDKDASYLGDGVYAMWDGYGVWLRANDFHKPTDEVYLEPEVLTNLNLFVERYLRPVSTKEKQEEEPT